MQWEIRGVDRFNAQLAEIARRMDRATDVGVDDGLTLVQEEAARLLTEKTHPPGTPTPSAPGEPPALISGALRRSIRARRDPSSGGIHRGRIGPTIVYGRIQELGGTIVPRTARMLSWMGGGVRHFARSVHLHARPFMKPAVDASRPRVRARFRELWQTAWRP